MIVTDLCEEAALLARAVLQQAMGAPSEVAVNPFRCPLRTCAADNRLPAYSNGFIFTCSASVAILAE